MKQIDTLIEMAKATSHQKDAIDYLDKAASLLFSLSESDIEGLAKDIPLPLFQTKKALHFRSQEIKRLKVILPKLKSE